MWKIKQTSQFKKDYKRYIKGDYLLIWYDKDEGVIKLSRLGTHSELFGE